MANSIWVYNSHGEKYEVPRVPVSSLNELQRADHIAFHRQSGAYWHHAIVEWINLAENKIHVIEYSNDARTFLEHLKNNLESGKANDIKKAKVVMATYNFQDEVVFLMKHKLCLDPEDVIMTAKKKLGEEKYDLFTNNCEHFAMWCKTGKSTSDQVNKAKRMAVKELGKSAVKTIVQHQVAKKCLTQTVSKAVGKKSFNAGFQKIGSRLATKEVKTQATSKGLDVVCSAAIESVFVGYDIYCEYQDKREGTISETEFNRAAMKRLITGTGNVAGSTWGAAIGQVVIPIPFVGATVGATVGALSGQFVGNLVAYSRG